MKISKLLILFCFIAFLGHSETFKVKDVRVSGLQRITAGSFFNYMPVKRGMVIDDADYANIIRQLYQTGFFKDVKLSRDNNVLVISVEERPIIGQIDIDGNKEIKDKTLLQGLVSMGLGEGDAFDEMKLVQAEKELLNLYHSRSKFDVIIDATAKPLDQGRVRLKIDIREGISARIKQINIIGNKAFSEKKILDEMKSTTSKWHSLITKGDRYSGERLQADIDAIESFYYNRGYLDFRVNSTQVSLTDDKKDVYITVSINEGLPYRVDSNVFSKSDIVSEEKLNDLLAYAIGDYYSRQAVRESQQNIKEAFGAAGYAFANVRVTPRVNATRQDVSLVYDILPGRKSYVRRIEFTGNYKTNDEVLRREMRQMEAAPYNQTKLKRSDERIRRLGYIKSVKRHEVSVPGHPDQVDVVYEISEAPNRSITAGVGYGSSSGFMFNVGYQTGSFLGTGNHFKLDISRSESETSYAIKFTDPYFTVDGISRTFDFYYSSVDESETNIGDWASDDYGAFMRFGFPINEYESFSLGGGYRGAKIKTGNKVDPEIPRWLDKHGHSFDEFVLDFSWVHDTRDKTIFSNSGSLTRLYAELVTPGSSETYYKLNARNRTYFKLADKLLFSLHGDVSYGDGYGDTKDVPFFRHYYAGGLTTVRGFKSNTLGPRWDNGDIKGGDFRVAGGAELILPWTLGADEETVRLGLFTDFGNVYNTINDFDESEFRYSAGAYILWRSPIGPLNLSYGVPLNEKEGDQIERFQFTIGVPL